MTAKNSARGKRARQRRQKIARAVAALSDEDLAWTFRLAAAEMDRRGLSKAPDDLPGQRLLFADRLAPPDEDAKAWE